MRAGTTSVIWLSNKSYGEGANMNFHSASLLYGRQERTRKSFGNYDGGNLTSANYIAAKKEPAICF